MIDRHQIAGADSPDQKDGEAADVVGHDFLQAESDTHAQRATEDFPPPHVKEPIRALLPRGGFKPAGRNKPASEYLAQAAREARFPRINNCVYINNLLSLESGLPISLLDLAALPDSPHAAVRVHHVLRHGGHVVH